jgi:signal peptidase I
LSAPSRPHAFFEYAEAILVAVLFALFAKTFVFEAFEIPSASMEPTLLVGDHVVVNKFLYGQATGPWRFLLPHRGVRRGDVVVFRAPHDPRIDLVKRAVAVPADRVSMKAKELSLDDAPVREPYVVHRDPDVFSSDAPAALRARDEMGPLTIPDGAFLALGDNRDNSRDSRFFGAVPLRLVKGRTLFVYWSVESRAETAGFRGRGAAVRRLLDTALHFFDRTRWRRSFRPVR